MSREGQLRRRIYCALCVHAEQRMLDIGIVSADRRMHMVYFVREALLGVATELLERAGKLIERKRAG